MSERKYWGEVSPTLVMFAFFLGLPRGLEVEVERGEGSGVLAPLTALPTGPSTAWLFL
jgi:hypothetical protein